MPWCGACTRALGAVMESASWARGWRDCKQVRALSVSRVVPPFLFAVVMGVFLLLSVVQVPRRRGQQSVLCRRLSMDIDCQCHCTTRDSCFLCVCSYRVSVGALMRSLHGFQAPVLQYSSRTGGEGHGQEGEEQRKYANRTGTRRRSCAPTPAMSQSPSKQDGQMHAGTASLSPLILW